MKTMTKRKTCLLLLMLLLLGACSKSPAVFTADQVEQLTQAGVFSEELETLDAEIAFALYQLDAAGLERGALQSCTVLRSAGATCEEAAFFLFDQESSAQEAQTALENYLVSQIDANQQYRPSEIPKLEQAILSQKKESLILVVCSDEQKAREILGLKP